MWHKIKKFFLDLLFPIQCLGCGQSDGWLCQNCWERIKINQLVKIQADNEWSQFLAGVLVVADYNQPLLQQILHNYKYNFIIDLNQEISQLIVKFLRQNHQEEELDFDFIIPVPLAKKRLIWRGFNQIEILAREVASAFNWPCRPDLIKRRHAHPQVGLNAKERIRNVQGIFTINNVEVLKNKKILLIDDVLTTGATLGECSKLLKEAGAKEVWGLVIAKG